MTLALASSSTTLTVRLLSTVRISFQGQSPLDKLLSLPVDWEYAVGIRFFGKFIHSCEDFNQQHFSTSQRLVFLLYLEAVGCLLALETINRLRYG